MAISRTFAKKAPNQRPMDFYACKQNGVSMPKDVGAKSPAIPVRLVSGPMREKIDGRKDLGDYK